ncbi:MAG: PLP-dependent aminotransferase family protein [Alphaproteobacteria bacterium]|nr:PLP-dependent aminotransferase family protein [Alphaproteobacteria bacterium]
MDLLFPLRRGGVETLQAQIRQHIAAAIEDGRLPPGARLPSSRALAGNLRVARNSVILAYQRLIDEGYLEAVARRGVRVAADPLPPDRARSARSGAEAGHAGSWDARFALRAAPLRHITKPADWRRYPYAFLHGQADRTLFPLSVWRSCTRAALARGAVESWSADEVQEDDRELVRQIRQRILPRRGVHAEGDEILITLGAQQALDLVLRLLGGAGRRVAIEDPGYADARNLALVGGATLMPIAIDESGLPIDDRLAGCDLAYVTPSHQSPTTVTLPFERRVELLARAERDDFVIVEDDYETEASYLDSPTPALKSIDRRGRVIYVGTLSKVLAPGLRLGFLVAPPAFVREARALRRLSVRQTPANNQRTAALFLAGGHYDAMQRRLRRVYRERWSVLREAIARDLRGCRVRPNRGGTSFWLEGPADLDADELARRARAEGVVVEPGRVYFADEATAPRNCFRLGFSVIAADRIDEGIRRLARAMG